MILLSTSVYLEYLEGISIGNLKIISFGKLLYQLSLSGNVSNHSLYK